jgi:hypothetical protein
VGWILGFTILGGMAFLLISNVKLSDAKKMLIDFSREVIPLIPRQAARKLGLGNENKKSTK